MPTKDNPDGYLCLMLHAHLPFVRHPEYEDSMEERWLYEAITETYIPLLDMFEGLLRDGVDFRMTMSITPPLAAMLTDDLLQRRYQRHIERLLELANKEVKRTQNMPEYRSSALMYQRKFSRARELFVDQHGRNLAHAFNKVAKTGKLELITCGATHGFQPLLQTQPEAVRAQIRIARRHYEEVFGVRPRGIWNGECGYFPGLDLEMRSEGIKFFFVDAHAILYADRRPKYGVYAPVLCPESGCAAFGRDLETSLAVWSADTGYPGDPVYREFFRDVGYDLPFDYVKPYIHESGMRLSTGVKYQRVTGKVDLADKQPYSPEAALQRAADHAGNFMFNREKQVEWLAGNMDRKPIIASPYDAELFGHWWYEGPDFLNYFFRKCHYDQQRLGLITPSEYLEMYPVNQVCQPTMSSWGNKGYCEVWLEGSNDWIYRHLHKAAERMIYLARNFRAPSDIERRALNQAARELLLAQSSDWAFIMKTGTTVEYAVKRTKEHILNFTDLFEQLQKRQIDADFVGKLEWKNNIFQNIDYKIYR
ncbi:DUF1957 domain-containing protein [Candidatus Sumerlaeota bacterium]|nr:DUF1957 domain-containing protein [Candidatus Sumerlaeota bacterium]